MQLNFVKSYELLNDYLIKKLNLNLEEVEEFLKLKNITETALLEYFVSVTNSYSK